MAAGAGNYRQLWLTVSPENASRQVYGAGAMCFGEGWSIPFMCMLGERFPQAQFMITGVLGPRANAHGPNAFLDLAYARKLTVCVAKVIADHHHRPKTCQGVIGRFLRPSAASILTAV